MADNWSTIARRIRVPLGFLLAVLYVWLARPTARSIVLGVTVAVAGLMIRALASGHVEKNQRLTTSGPYAYTRNPLYLGSLIIGAGFAVAARSGWIAAAMAALFLAIYMPVIRSEEAYLRRAFPEFDAYAARVPRLLPRLSGASYNAGSFSWELYRKHREYNAALGAIAITAVLVIKLMWFR
jgi:protein-S-isoprenylcysteine O-methyltransferase Ste14